MLASVGEIFEKLVQAYLKYFGTAAGIMASIATAKKLGESPDHPLIKQYRSQASEFEHKMSDCIDETFNAYSKLALLGEYPALEAAKLLSNTITKSSDLIDWVGDKPYDESRFDENNLKIEAAHAVFFEEMRKAFDRSR